MNDSAILIEPLTPVQRVQFALGDTFTATRRFVLRSLRQPDVILGIVLLPIIFVVLFGYVFGSSITVTGGDYRPYLMSGLFAQSTLFAAGTVAVAVATDMSEGVIDRFKTLPITRSSILIGRTASTLIVGLPGLAVMIVCALVVGWSPQDGLGNALLAFALIVVFGFAMSWLGVVVGLLARSPQAADGLSMIPTFLLGFVSNIFVDTSQLPQWLRVFADWNPLSTVVVAVRELFGTTQGTVAPGVWPLSHPILATLIMCFAILAVCLPVSVRLYSRSTH